MNKETLQEKLTSIAQQHDGQVKAVNDAQLMVNKLAGAYEVIKDILDNWIDEAEVVVKVKEPKDGK